MPLYFPATALGGRLYIDQTPQDEIVVAILVETAMHRRIDSLEALRNAMAVSWSGPASVRAWIREDLLDEARQIAGRE